MPKQQTPEAMQDKTPELEPEPASPEKAARARRRVRKLADSQARFGRYETRRSRVAA